MNKVDFLWLRLNELVPQPQCSTFDNDFDSIDWKDTRAKPTLAQVQAVDPAPLVVAIQAKQSVQVAAAGEFKALTVLAGKTDAQIASWVQANVTDLASAKAAIAVLARAVGALARDRGL